MTATIQFGDGSSIIVEENGNCFITDEKPDFPDNLDNITISDEDGERILSKSEIIECASIDDKYWFSLREITEEELAREKLDAQVTFTALCTDTLLED